MSHLSATSGVPAQSLLLSQSPTEALGTGTPLDRPDPRLKTGGRPRAPLSWTAGAIAVSGIVSTGVQAVRSRLEETFKAKG